MYSLQVYNSTGGLSPKIGLINWAKLNFYSYEQAAYKVNLEPGTLQSLVDWGVGPVQLYIVQGGFQTPPVSQILYYAPDFYISAIFKLGCFKNIGNFSIQNSEVLDFGL